MEPRDRTRLERAEVSVLHLRALVSRCLSPPMRCLGIDYGERRIGLSYGDELGVAVPLPAATEPEATTRLDHVVRVARERRATDFVVGYPYNMDGSVGFKAREVEVFIERLLERMSLPVHRVDERLSTRTAGEHLPRRRDDELRRSGRIDSMAACVILQDFLSHHLPPPDQPEGDEACGAAGQR